MRLYLKFFAMHLKSRMAYKRSFFFSIVGQFMTAFTAFLALSFLFQRFGTVKGYTYGETLLCASVTLTSFALAESLFRGFDRFPAIFIRNAEFDRILVRPRGLIFQVLCQEIEFSRLGKLLQSLLMLGVGISRSPVTWSAGKAALLAAMVLGGTAVFIGLFLIYAALSFFTLEGLEFMNCLTDGAREFAAYPLDVYGKDVLKFCTCVVPYALFQYYPLTVLLGRSDRALHACMPLLSIAFLAPCLLLWRVGVRRYKSAGS